MLLNPAWGDPAIFAAYERIAVHEREPFAANALLIGGTCLCAAHCPRTAGALEQRGVAVRRAASDELAKAEAGLTCGSVLVHIV